jgi:hypothetical protein
MGEKGSVPLTNGTNPTHLGMMSDHQPKSLLQEIEEFLSRQDLGMTETAFGIAALKDGKLIPNLRNGRRLWPETEAKVRNFIASEIKRLSEEAPEKRRRGALA